MTPTYGPCDLCGQTAPLAPVTALGFLTLVDPTGVPALACDACASLALAALLASLADDATATIVPDAPTGALLN